MNPWGKFQPYSRMQNESHLNYIFYNYFSGFRIPYPNVVIKLRMECIWIDAVVSLYTFLNDDICDQILHARPNK